MGFQPGQEGLSGDQAPTSDFVAGQFPSSQREVNVFPGDTDHPGGVSRAVCDWRWLVQVVGLLFESLFSVSGVMLVHVGLYYLEFL